MTGIALQKAIELGLIYGLVALGIYISYRVLNLADLTVEGSFTFGAAASIMVTILGYPWLGIIAATLCGGIAGWVTAFLQTKLKIQSILAGILTMTALYSINLKVMGNKASVNIIKQESIFTPFQAWFGDWGKLILILIVVLAVAIMLVLFMNTEIGLAIRATGDNERMVNASSIQVDFMKTLGLILANALVGLSGGVLAQYQQSAEASMGIGVVVIALASLIIGEVLFGNLFHKIFKKQTVLTSVVAVLIGATLYRIIIAFVLQYNNHPVLAFLKITASDMKLLSSLIVILALSYPVIQEQIKRSKQKRGLKHAGNS